MNITGIICEYNPLHAGHKKQLDTIRAAFPHGGIVCLMSGNYVQRGKPAIFHKSLRAKAAIACGADLVLELPVTAALSSAEGFAANGVRILSFCDRLCFGAETANAQQLMGTARALLSDEFTQHLRLQLDKGLSFPAARQAALEAMGLDAALLSNPNDILAVEYCKAILAQASPLQPMPIFRGGDYHACAPEVENPSATAVRKLMEAGEDWCDYVPDAARDCFRDADLHTFEAGQRAVLARLRCMTDAEFEAIPYGSEGLWRKLMHAVREYTTVEQILTAVKSKRYTRTRLDRMLMCAFLGLTQEQIQSPAPYTRVLAFNDTGRQILKEARLAQNLPNIGQKQDDPYQQIETRCGRLYGLFCAAETGAPDEEAETRVQYIPGTHA